MHFHSLASGPNGSVSWYTSGHVLHVLCLLPASVEQFSHSPMWLSLFACVFGNQHSPLPCLNQTGLFWKHLVWVAVFLPPISGCIVLIRANSSFFFAFFFSKGQAIFS